MAASVRQLVYKHGSRMPERQVFERAAAFLKKNNVGVLSTVHAGAPEGCAMEYASEGLTVYLITEPSRKVQNILTDNRVSFTVFSVDEADSGVHEVAIVGRAELLETPFLTKSAELSEQPWVKHVADLKHVQSLNLETVKIVRISPTFIKILDMAGLKKGYSVVQRATPKNLQFWENAERRAPVVHDAER